MRKAITILTGLLLVAALASPAFAFYRVISDDYNRSTGTGVAVVEISRGEYARITYLDVDGSQSFTPRDQKMKVELVRPGDDGPGRPTIGRAPTEIKFGGR